MRRFRDAKPAGTGEVRSSAEERRGEKETVRNGNRLTGTGLRRVPQRMQIAGLTVADEVDLGRFEQRPQDAPGVLYDEPILVDAPDKLLEAAVIEALDRSHDDALEGLRLGEAGKSGIGSDTPTLLGRRVR